MQNPITNNPTISVIMSVYNGEKYLKESIESIIKQTYGDFEFIIINDGSTDQTKNIIQEYADKDSRIILIHQEKNTGLIDCLNLGLSLARGKYFARMDADDISLPNRFKIQKDFLDCHPGVGLVGGNFHVIDSSGKRTSNIINNPSLPVYHNQIYWGLCFSICIAHVTIMARLELIIQASGYKRETTNAEDYDLWTRLAPRIIFHNVPQKLVIIRRHENNVTLINNDPQMKTRKQISKYHISQILQRNISLEMMDNLYSTEPVNLIWAKQIVKLFNDVFRNITSANYMTKGDVIFIKKKTAQFILEIRSREQTSAMVRNFLFQSAIRFHLPEVYKYLTIKALRNIWKKIKQSIQ
jgi:glycosyltransferase involved in cell wall biosynthesis